MLRSRFGFCPPGGNSTSNARCSRTPSFFSGFCLGLVFFLGPAPAINFLGGRAFSCGVELYRRSKPSSPIATKNTASPRLIIHGTPVQKKNKQASPYRSEEHTSELQSRPHLVCRLLLEKKMKKFARLGDRRGFEFVVMYGQTEATARLAYVPAELAARAAGSFVRPIPGCRLRIESEPGA